MAQIQESIKKKDNNYYNASNVKVNKNIMMIKWQLKKLIKMINLWIIY